MRNSLSTVLLGALLLALPGCGTVGPTMLRNGRGIYNDAISSTNDQQILETIVHGRYGRNTGLLAVASVTSSVTAVASTSAEFGIGSDDSFAGNLTPFQIGGTYEENPTITYLPVQGEQYLTRLLSPLPLGLTMLLVAGSHGSERMMLDLVGGINGIRNAAFLRDGAVPDSRFSRVAHLLAELCESGRVSWVAAGASSTTGLLFSGYAEDRAAEVQELFSLLGLDSPGEVGSDVLVPVVASVGPSSTEIRIETRSLFTLLQIAEAVTEVPAEDLEQGFAKRFPPLGTVGQGLRIGRGRSAPKYAAVAIEDRGWTYYIEGNDLMTKSYFRLLEVLLTVLMSDSTSQVTPLLTLPVSR